MPTCTSPSIVQDAPLRRNWIRAPVKFDLYRAIGASNLPSMPKLLAYVLLGYTDASGRNAWPSLSTLARDCGWKDKSTAKRHLKTLVDAHCVRVVARKDSSGAVNLSNLYEFMPEWVGAQQHSPIGAETVGGADETPPREPTSTDGEVSPDPQTVPLPDPLPVKSAATTAVESLRLVKAAVPAGFPRKTCVALARHVDSLMEDGTAVEVVAETLRMWMDRPNAAPGLLPFLAADVMKSRASAARPAAGSASAKAMLWAGIGQQIIPGQSATPGIGKPTRKAMEAHDITEQLIRQRAERQQGHHTNPAVGKPTLKAMAQVEAGEQVLEMLRLQNLEAATGGAPVQEAIAQW